MIKIIPLIKTDQFWFWFGGTAVGMFVFELLLMGRFAIPIINYQVPYMGSVGGLDIGFAAVFAILFGFGTAMFVLAKKFNAASCAVGGGSGLLAFFTLLCPVCPVFFLAYFGLSATVMAIAPYFWWLRLVSLVIMLVGIVLLYKKFEPRNLPKMNIQLFTQKVAIILIGILIVGNQAMAMNIGHQMMGGDMSHGVSLSGDFGHDVSALVTPQSLPFYGPELGLDFSSLENINTSIRKMSVMAPQQGSNPIQLNEAEMKRYVAIGTEPYITCEFCCGVKTLVREDGSPTCGCAHSIAMRGTAAYLIQNYPEMSNAEIAYELVRQKGMYFPTQMQQRMASSLAGDKSEFKPDIKYLTMNLTDSELTNLQQKAKTSGFVPEENVGMVGGC